MVTCPEIVHKWARTLIQPFDWQILTEPAWAFGLLKRCLVLSEPSEARTSLTHCTCHMIRQDPTTLSRGWSAGWAHGSERAGNATHSKIDADRRIGGWLFNAVHIVVHIGWLYNIMRKTTMFSPAALVQVHSNRCPYRIRAPLIA